MKKIITILSASAILAVSCDSNLMPAPEKEHESTESLVPVSLKIAGINTKATAVNSDEEKINNLQVFVYTVNSGQKTFDSYYTFGTEDERTIFIDSANETATYWIAAYANQPGIESGPALKDWALFANESDKSFQMAGQTEMTAESILQNKEVRIDLVRQCSKVTVEEVAVEWTNTANRYKTFKLKGMYLMDVPGVVANFFTVDQTVLDNTSLWQNRNGHTSESHDALLYDEIADFAVSESEAYTIDHIFYGYISPLTTYNTDESWEPGGTRLVIEAEFDGQACYYAVALNGIEKDPATQEKITHSDLRNMHIIFNKITITRPGAEKPYLALPDESPITVSVSVKTWQPGYTGNYIIQ